ncbi:Serine protease, subtilisin family [Friedmanniella luteola]|uniref:Serine protease, subtilisin family n=1 Tax=Friedmanniella luteola TaxID=546871 RepID=A0A1H1ZNC6_9ACTN|nr:S8 family serine peptidase [Friedmanniella luteola]SDT35204.1 Serine protease, subtilisin family [Friedmanniella luteola]
MNRLTGALAAAALVSSVSAGLTLPAHAAPESGPTARYIVRTDAVGGADDAAQDVRRLGGDVEHVYSEVFPGLAATLTADQARRLRASDEVAEVVPDRLFHATGVQTNAPWALDRLDQRPVAGNKTYRYDTTGEGAFAFVLDTGLRFGHQQFGGRAVSGYDFVDLDDDASDCDGHGTHVAGSIGGAGYGVAKGVTLVGVRVLDCEGAGYASDIIWALDWVAEVAADVPAVVNLSLGGPALDELDEAVERTVRAGIPVVVAAGNENGDACDVSPARVPAAITVAAVDSADRRARFSNRGRCVDLFAPGVAVRSASNLSNTATEVMSGTSMAAPHVTGAVARYLGAHPTATPAQAVGALTRTAGADAVRDRAGSPDRLLYTGPVTAPGKPTKVAAKKNDRARTATVSWSTPVADGGRAVTGYRVTRNGKDARGQGPVTVTVSAGTRSHTFPRLRKGSAYTFTVRAVNAVGAGAPMSTSVPKLR